MQSPRCNPDFVCLIPGKGASDPRQPEYDDLQDEAGSILHIAVDNIGRMGMVSKTLLCYFSTAITLSKFACLVCFDKKQWYI